MSLLRAPRPLPSTEEPAHSIRIRKLEDEIRSLTPSPPSPRPEVAQGAPVGRPSRGAPERIAKLLLLAADLACEHVRAGQTVDARRVVGDAIAFLDELEASPFAANHEVAIAHGAVMIGEALVAIDAPKHAKPRLRRAVEILDRHATEPRWRIRARLALGRALVALDDVTGLEALEQCRQANTMLGDAEAVAAIDRELAAAARVFDTPRHIHTGYGRPVSVFPTS